MRKKAIILAFAVLLTLACVPVCADHGLPSGPMYSVPVNIYGAEYYRDRASCESGNAEGTIPGGTRFYVWSDFDTYYQGTTDANLSSDNYEELVWISSGSLGSETETISPDAGQKTDSVKKAVATDELNLRCGPGTGFKVIKVLSKNTELTYDHTFDTDTTWMYVDAGGTSGWACGDYLMTTGADEAVSEPAAQTGSGPAAPETPAAQETAQDKRGVVAGIILICVGVAILVAAFALYYLNRKKKGPSNP